MVRCVVLCCVYCVRTGPDVFVNLCCKQLWCLNENKHTLRYNVYIACKLAYILARPLVYLSTRGSHQGIFIYDSFPSLQINQYNQ